MQHEKVMLERREDKHKVITLTAELTLYKGTRTAVIKRISEMKATGERQHASITLDESNLAVIEARLAAMQKGAANA